MTIEKSLIERASSRCELCSSREELAAYDVKPNAGQSVDTSVLLCGPCRTRIQDPVAAGETSWYGLKESMWSEHPSVRVLTYRILKSLAGSAWAQDLLQEMYLDDETQAWADAGLSESRAAAAAVLDSNGTRLQDGDTVTLIKDLDVKGANFTAKRGTTVKNISLTDDPKYVEGRVNGIRIVLVAAYLKKA